MFQSVENVYEGEQVFRYESIGHYQKWEIICENYLYVEKALVVKGQGRKSIQMCRRKMAR